MEGDRQGKIGGRVVEGAQPKLLQNPPRAFIIKDRFVESKHIPGAVEIARGAPCPRVQAACDSPLPRLATGR